LINSIGFAQPNQASFSQAHRIDLSNSLWRQILYIYQAEMFTLREVHWNHIPVVR